MCPWRALFLILGVLSVSLCCASTSKRLMPSLASGTFIQHKTLADVQLTLHSSGTFRFEKGRTFSLRTLKPLVSIFEATPTNYAFTVNGETIRHALPLEVDQFEKIFLIKEMKDFVQEVRLSPETGFPTHVDVLFKNGDRLTVDFQLNE